MVFARVVRPPHHGAKLVSLDEAAVRSLPGVVAVVRDGNFLAVAAKREEQAIAARNALASAARWSDDAVALPDITDLHGELKRFRAETIIVGATGQSEPVPDQSKRVSAEYARSYLSHGSIGPSCAVAWLKDGHMTVWSHTQGAFPLRGDLAKVLGMQNSQVDVVHTPGAGCYGPQRCGRRSLRRGSGGPSRRRHAGQTSVDARRRVRLGALRSGNGDEGRGGARI